MNLGGMRKRTKKKRGHRGEKVADLRSAESRQLCRGGANSLSLSSLPGEDSAGWETEAQGNIKQHIMGQTRDHTQVRVGRQSVTLLATPLCGCIHLAGPSVGHPSGEGKRRGGPSRSLSPGSHDGKPLYSEAHGSPALSERCRRAEPC